ncbi:MAG: enoyl-CoA hydratase [Frankiales bacterium]|nr:enoyl-CoA hydratase [Frankiales bacterium]
MINLTDQGAVTVVRLEHGKVNALDLELLRAITATFTGLRGDGGIVLTGQGRAFSAGVDLKRIVDGGTAYVDEFLPALSEAFLAVYDCPRPVVAAINGHAIAGGCVFAGASDVRLMSGGTIGLSELLVGVPFPTVPLEIMRDAVGPVIRRLALTGETFAPTAALRLGLIDEIVEPEALMDEALRRAEALGQIPADVYALTKTHVHAPARERIEALRTQNDAIVRERWAAGETRDGIAAFLTNL